MRNYLVIGPIRIRLSMRHLAPWGYARLAIGGLSFLSRTSGGDLTLASYHPRGSLTWHWSAALIGSVVETHRASRRTGQWHDYYRLPFGRCLLISHQDYHKQAAVRAARHS